MFFSKCEMSEHPKLFLLEFFPLFLELKVTQQVIEGRHFSITMIHFSSHFEHKQQIHTLK